MRSKFYHPVILIVFCLSFAFMGCGSGGSGSGSSGGDSGISYSGETAPAEIDEDNADDIAAGAFAAGQSSMGRINDVSRESVGQQGQSQPWLCLCC